MLVLHFDILSAVILCALCISSAPYRAPEPVQSTPERVLTLYESATVGTDIPPDLLRAIAIVESGEDDDAVGDGGISHGRFQINERFRAERVRLYGNYDPSDPEQAALVAAGILQAHFERFGSWPLALTAYNGGARFARENGRLSGYLGRIATALDSIGSNFDVYHCHKGLAP